MILPRTSLTLLVMSVASALAQGPLPSSTNGSATKRIKTAHGNYAIWVNEKKWTLTKQSATAHEERLEFVKGPSLVVVISEPVGGVAANLLPELALVNLKKIAPTARIVSTERRSVKGAQLIAAEYLFTENTAKGRAYAYFHSGTSGTIQLIGMTLESVFADEVADILEFLNGIEISDGTLPTTAPVATPQRSDTAMAQGSREPSQRALAGGQSEFTSEYPTRQRIQISEPCAVVGKWITQGLISGPRWHLLRSDLDLGLLIFAMTDSEMSKAEAQNYISDLSKKDKGIRVEQVAFTLRSLVSSRLSFENGPSSSGESCTISAALKFSTKDGRPLLSNGIMEAELLQRFKQRYAAHGLDY
jgi:hypothetical protein